MSLAERRWLRIFTLCALYVAQGIPWGFMTTTLPAYLTKRGLDFGFVTTTLAFTTLPYSFKWIWGPIVDTVQIEKLGRRRPWIVFAQAMMAVTVLTIVALDVTQQVKLLAWMILIHTVFNSLQDVATDALAVDILPDEDRGRANGLMYASKYGGGLIGGGVMAGLIVRTNLDTALLVQTSILVAIMLLPLFVREGSGPAPRRERAAVVGRALVQAFSLRSTLVAAVLMLVGTFSIGLVAAIGFPLFIETLHWEPDKLTAITGFWALLVGGVCAASAGYLSDRFGRRRVAVIAAFALAAGWIAFSLLHDSWTNKTLIYVFAFYEAACQGVFVTVLIALAMDLSWPRIAGSQFTTYMALSNYSTTLGYLFAKRAHEWWQFPTIYLVAAAVQLAITPLFLPIDPTETRRSLPLPEGKRANITGVVCLGVLVVLLIGMTVYDVSKKLG